MFALVMSLTNTVDLVNPALSGHHAQVAFIAGNLAEEMGMDASAVKQLVLAGALHDIGATSLPDRTNFLEFELNAPHRHAFMGSRLLDGFQPTAELSNLIRYHHVEWNQGKGAFFKDNPVPAGSHILHLADRVAVQIDKKQPVLGQVENILKRINQFSGSKFNPEMVEALFHLSKKESFWLDLVSSKIPQQMESKFQFDTLNIDAGETLGLAEIFRKIIDYRSSFTANHSAGVAATSTALAKLAHFSEHECRMMYIAGLLHDLGKLAVPTEILEKEGKLTADDFAIMRSHTYHTYRALEPIKPLKTVNEWASFHHERLDGNGYPFHITGPQLSLGSRIMAVADVSTALLEDRPYRAGMAQDEATRILERMSKDAIDGDIVNILKANFEEVNSQRIIAQTESGKEYRKYISF
ncbi:MAG: HD domain-containing protein [Dehalococcoidales bacterium]|nr:HD domain-containing protein [Dehalococcoidales bacterium]MDD4466080.1 HD domain-containing protein [Dehalococcoidales bacterium]